MNPQMSLRLLCNFWVAALGVCFASWHVEAQVSRLPAIPLYGREYVRVNDMARTFGMSAFVQGRSVTLKSQYVNLRLEIDSREASLNGTKLWLSLPPTSARGMTLISRTDAIKVLDPVLFPPRSTSPAAFRAIVIDPGHGGVDEGARSRTGLQEKMLALDLSKRLQQLLAQKGFVVSLTRARDKTLPLDERVKIAKELRAGLFVSLHFNSEGRGSSARGIETYCLTPSGAASTASTRSRTLGPGLPGNRFDDRNMLLAYSIHRNVLASAKAPDRGVRRARFYVLQYADCPAILIECGFLSNRAEATRISTTAYRDQLARGIAEGILDYKRILER